MKRFFENNMLWVIIIFILIELNHTRFGWSGIGSWDLNRSIGWGWTIKDYLFDLLTIHLFALFVFFLGYLIIRIAKRKTNFYLSLAHTLVLFLGAFIFQFEAGLFLIYLSSSLLVFLINLVYSVKQRVILSNG